MEGPRSLKSGSIGPCEKSDLMNRAFHAADRIIRAAREHARPAIAIASVVLACAAAGVPRAHAAPFIWDQDDDSIDDRIETVNAFGYSYSFEGADTLSQQRVEVVRQSGGLLYGVYVVFDHDPTPSDLL